MIIVDCAQKNSEMLPLGLESWEAVGEILEMLSPFGDG